MGLRSRSLFPGTLFLLQPTLAVLLANLALCPPASAQYWQFVKTIGVGESPERMAISSNGRELYVANRTSCSVSVIDLQRNENIATIELGSAPHAMVAGNGRIYVLEYDPPADRPCPSRAAGRGWSLAIVDSADQKLAAPISLPYNDRWDELALTPDGKRLFLTAPYHGVFVFDTAAQALRPEPVIQDLCPIGIAVSAQQQKIFVNYQCLGPPGGGTMTAHDSMGVYELSPPYRRIAVIAGLPNVGGQVALSPDGVQLWADGNDACSRPDYPHDGCPGFPVRVMNIVNTSDLTARSYGFSMAEFDGRISFSPEGEVFVGGGDALKEIPKPTLGVVTRVAVPQAGDVAFRRDGRVEYMYVAVMNKGLVQLLTRSQCNCNDRGQQADVASAACRSEDNAKKAETARPPAPGRNYALVIGINEYDHWQHLANPAHDADDVAHELRDHYNFEVQELPGPGCGEAHDPGHSCRLTKNDFLSALRSYAADANGQRRSYNDQDQLLIYIGSHGAYDEVMDRGFLIASDSETKDNDPNHVTQISHSELREILDRLPVKHIFVMIDACFAGTYDPTLGTGVLRGNEEYTPIPVSDLRTRYRDIVTREFLTSGGKTFVPDGSKRNSPFAQIFIQALETSGAGGYWTIAKLRPQFQLLPKQQPRQGPFGSDNGQGEFFFVYAPASATVRPAGNCEAGGIGGATCPAAWPRAPETPPER